LRKGWGSQENISGGVKSDKIFLGGLEAKKGSGGLKKAQKKGGGLIHV